MQQKQGVIASPIGLNVQNEVFEDTKVALDTLLARLGPFRETSRARAGQVIENGLNVHGEMFSFQRADGGTTTYFLIPAIIHVK